MRGVREERGSESCLLTVGDAHNAHNDTLLMYCRVGTTIAIPIYCILRHMRTADVARII